LDPGSYCVQFDLSTLPATSSLTQKDVGNDAADSDADLTTGKTSSVTLAAGEHNPTLDAGIVIPTPPEPASLGDFVWEDTNRNGVQDNGEPPVEGVLVELLAVCDGSPISSMSSNANGIYSFTNLQPGDYLVQFTLPAGYVFTTPNAGGNDAVDSDAALATGCTQLTTLTAGENDPTWDAGIVTIVTQPGTAGLGDFVWVDTNQNGLQDPGEVGVPGVTVNLFPAAEPGAVSVASTDAPLASATTDANGEYLFMNLVPGSYFVEFVAPPEYIFTLANANGNTQEAIDSDPRVPLVRLNASDGGVTAPLGTVLTYTFFYTNADANLIATDVVISTTVPEGTTFVAAQSDPAWVCTNANAGGTCTITLPTLAANTTGSALFAVLLGEDEDEVPEILDLPLSITQGTEGSTETLTLVAGDFSPTLDAGLTDRSASGPSRVETPTEPPTPTGLPPIDQPDQHGGSIYLPSVQSQE
jgi:hypothetical protein